ncbi:MAG: DNA alkylation repair protein [Turicibacter sp.]|nr:DNA alkylation repair protein [Turicibacter sp.]
MNIKAQLLEFAELDYQRFSARLLPGTPNILGVRLPILRKMAKQIAKENGREYLKQNDEVYFEEFMLKGMVIGYLKDTTVHEMMSYIRHFVPKINNWSVCDSFCSGLKITKQNQQVFWPMLIAYLSSEEDFEVRFAVVMMLTYYVDNQYVTEILKEFDRIKHTGYYVRMAIAWAISICYVKYPQLTLNYLETTTLDTYTYNKALQKISELTKSDAETKALMKQMKRNEKILGL